MNYTDVIIVGAGHAGAAVAISLRQAGFEGSITIVGREPEPPYERPPLSKEYLAREKPFERIYIRPPAFWAEKNITLLLSKSVVEVDAAGKRVVLDDGQAIGFTFLVWAAGGDARRLNCAGADLSGVHSVRSREDVDRMMAEIDAGARKAVIIGGGYIGLEAAAVLRKLGLEVILLEMLDRILARVAGEELSRFFEQEHRAQGVDLRLSTGVECIEGSDGRASSVKLADGTRLRADIVIVGIGIVPSVAPLLAAGATGVNGVNVDAYCRTSLPDVFAIGDCAAHASEFSSGQLIRLESVQNANDMARVTAKAILGAPEPYRATPWFWSNQYDLKLQTVGLSTGHDSAVVRGSAASRAFTVVYMRRGRVIALDCVNQVRDYVQGKRLVEIGARIDPALLADHRIPLKDMLD